MRPDSADRAAPDSPRARRSGTGSASGPASGRPRAGSGNRSCRAPCGTGTGPGSSASGRAGQSSSSLPRSAAGRGSRHTTAPSPRPSWSRASSRSRAVFRRSRCRCSLPPAKQPAVALPRSDPFREPPPIPLRAAQLRDPLLVTPSASRCSRKSFPPRWPGSLRAASVARHEHLLRVAQVLVACRNTAAPRILNRARPAPPLPTVSVAVFAPALSVLDGLPHGIERVPAPSFQAHLCPGAPALTRGAVAPRRSRPRSRRRP
jgi:hypothetical protein